MSFIRFSAEAEGMFSVLCLECSRPVMLATLAELGALSSNGVAPFCFDCWPHGVDSVPRQLVSSDHSYYMEFEELRFHVTWQDVMADGHWQLRFEKVSG